MDSGLSLVVFLTLGGIILLCAEVLLPGMIAGIVGVILLLLGVIASFYYYGPTVAGLHLLTIIVFGGTILGLWLKYFDRTPIGKDVILGPADKARSPYTLDQSLVGKMGISLTTLRPAGTIDVDGQRLDVITEGIMIPAKTSVEIISISGTVIIVRESTVSGKNT
ncbi:MAG: NfeD family protein [Verrucomicrobiota bacterium]|nr:NfeD family protein [Verrucomicrobiota bacterium]